VTDHVELRRGTYVDSVSLMQVSRQVAATPGLTAAQVAMATELNLELLAGMGFDIPAEAVPNDLVVALRSDNQAGVEAGLAAVEAALASLKTAGAGAGGFGEAPQPRTLGRAVRAGGATLALVSVPGQHATVEALDAIESGVSVMVFSDNVPVVDEIRLKDAAREQGVLVMGPDCGTAVVGGVALGFANVVGHGSVGIVAASGTGAQQVMCLLDAAGAGVSHCLGVGGRDMSAEVGGRSTRQALEALAHDESTSSIIVVSKPPAEDVLAEIEAFASALPVPVHWAMLGPGREDLTAAVERALATDGHPVPAWPSRPAPQVSASGGALRGLFCGGTLADEAMLIAAEKLGGIMSNIPLSPELALGSDLRADSHLVIDFGDDQMTQGRPHPMIDPGLRLERIAEEARDPRCGVLLLDLVLGHGAHPDPAGELGTAISSARATAQADRRELPVVVSLTGTEGDPQGFTTCMGVLHEAGASVFLSNAQATRHALSLLPSQEI